MDIGLLGQYIMNGLMLGMMYALVAVGFTLFFGVLDVINFSHGDVLTVGAFTGLATSIGLTALGVSSGLLVVVIVFLSAIACMAALGALIARYLVLPLKSAPALNTLLLTLMLGIMLHEAVRLFYPQGANPQRFPSLLSTEAYSFGHFTLRVDNALLLLAGLAVIIGVHLLINKTKLGLAIRAVAQINFGMGLLLGVIGFSAAVVGGLGNIYGAILGGFLFAALQTIGALALPFASAYKDVFAFGVVILIMAWRPTGLISERVSERV
jgi:branched-chain amino acid transport system permease protein